ncbi:hypothetical protein ZWY2020_026998 [Hordeum vulgare]|nr:hypothetical protein ZWY2020_026998 [Hordeum vulgare]
MMQAICFVHFCVSSRFTRWLLLKMLTRGLSVRQHNTLENQGKAKIKQYENAAMMVVPKPGMLHLGLD